MFYLLRRRENRHAFGQRQKDVRGPQGQGRSGTFLLSRNHTLVMREARMRAQTFIGWVGEWVCLCLSLSLCV